MAADLRRAADLSAAHRRIGRELALYLHSHPLPGLSKAQLQAVVADLTGGHSELMLPVWDLLRRPAFVSLVVSPERVPTPVAREALLQQLGDTFSPRIVAALAAVLDGFLNLPDAPFGVAIADPAAGSAQGLTDPVASSEASSPATAVAAWGESGAGDPVVAACRPRQARRRLLAFGLPVAVLAGVAAFSLTASCSRLGTCDPSALIRRNQEILNEAMDLETSLAAATTSRVFEQQHRRLQQLLGRLDSERLTAVQERQRQRLRKVDAQAAQTLSLEQQRSRRLQAAVASLAAAAEDRGLGGTMHLSQARRQLEALPETSRFDDGGQLRALRRQVGNRERAMASSAVRAVAPGDSAADQPSAPAPESRADGHSVSGARPQPASHSSSAGAALGSRREPYSPLAPAPVQVPAAPAASVAVEPTAQPSASRTDYRLPRQWEERRQRRRQIMDQYPTANP